MFFKNIPAIDIVETRNDDTPKTIIDEQYAKTRLKGIILGIGECLLEDEPDIVKIAWLVGKAEILLDIVAN